MNNGIDKKNKEPVGTERIICSLDDKVKAEESYTIGTTLHNKGELYRAIEYYEKALSLDPSLANAYYNLGNIHYDHGRIDQAVNCFQQTIRLHPNDAGAHYNLGHIFQSQGDLYQAVD